MPGDLDQLTIDAWDQFGARLLHDPDGEWAGEATYVSSDSAVVRVVGGLLTGLAPGVARITASLTIGQRTLTDSMTVKVSPLPKASGTVLRMNQYGRWGPIEVSLKAPATVSWVIPDGVQAPTIWLNVWSGPIQKLVFVQRVATRTFSAPSNYYYGTGGGLTWYDEGGVVVVF